MELEGPLHDGYPSETAKNLFPKQPAELSEDQHTRKILSQFLHRAFRREVQEEEVEHTTAAYRKFKKITNDNLDAMRKTMASVLVSPKFVYLVERTPKAKTEEARKLNAYELATRLSYFLWASMPDDELLDLAAKQKLLQTNVLKEQIERMRRDVKFMRFARHFGHQWLGLSSLENKP